MEPKMHSPSSISRGGAAGSMKGVGRGPGCIAGGLWAGCGRGLRLPTVSEAGMKLSVREGES